MKINGGAASLSAWAHANAIPTGVTTGHLLHRASREGCELDARRATSKRCERPGTLRIEDAHARFGVWGFALGLRAAAVVRVRHKGMTAEQFNERYEVGTPAIYRITHDATPFATKTRSKAWNLGHGEPVVLIEGKSGGVALWALQMPDHIST